MKKFQSGAYLVLMSLLMVALVGIGALALDLGRMFVVRSEVQNAADSAAVAAAAELDGSNGARARAELVARQLLVHDSAFTNDSNLLSEDLVTVAFFSELGDPPGSNRVPAVDDSDARFARVTVSQAAVRFLFLPVLGNTATEGFLSAAATAGRPESPQVCGFAPILLCTAGMSLPLGSGGSTFMAGSQVVIPLDEQPAGPGNWGFILPDHPDLQDAGNPTLINYLNNADSYCVDVETSQFGRAIPGQRINNPNVRVALNDFFGVDANSPAYPRDTIARTNNITNTVFGAGDWKPSSGANVQGDYQGNIDTYDTRLDAHEGLGNPNTEQRRFLMPVVQDCANTLSGRTFLEMEGFAEFFLTEPIVSGPGRSGGSPQIVAEFIGWGVSGGGGGGAGSNVVLYE